MSQEKQRIVILGAGYAGLLATLRLWKKTRRLPVAITLVNREATFGERTRFQQLATGQVLNKRPIVDFLRGTAVSFLQGCVTQLDLQQNQIVVKTKDGLVTVPYDQLIYALGSIMQPATLPGAVEYAHTLDRASAQALAAKMKAAKKTIGDGRERLVVIGGGATGIETAAEFAEQRPQLEITLVTSGKIGQMLSAKGKAYLRKALARLQVVVREDERVTAVFAEQVELSSQAMLPYDYCIWSGGFTAAPLAQEAGLSVNECGQILINATMRSVSHPNVYVAGDAASPLVEPGAPARMSQFFALVTGAHVADCVANDLYGRAAQPLGLSWVGLAISLGRRDCVAQFLYPDDTPRSLILTGKTAVWFKEFFVKFAIWSIKVQRTAPWLFYWLGKNKMRHVSLQL